MVIISPDKTFSLDHRVFYLATAQRRFVALTPEGHGSLVTEDLVSPLRLPEKPKQIALNPLGNRLAVASDRSLTIVDPSTGLTLASEPGSFDGCHYSGNGEHVWATRCVADGEASVELRDALTLKVVACISIQDPFDESSFMLFPNPVATSVTVWAAAGQEGQALFFVNQQATTLSVNTVADLHETTPPDFSPDGSSFLVIGAFGEVRQYSYPQNQLIRTIAWPNDEDDEDDDQIGDAVFFAGMRHALVQTSEGQLHILDLASGSYAEEVAILGHEPRPVPELYPTLSSDTGLCSDLSFVTSLGRGGFLSIHRRLPAETYDWRFEILRWHLGRAEAGSATPAPPEPAS